jgi:large subunit ribosomal protein L6
VSRIGKKPVPIPSGVKVEVKGCQVSAKGSKGDMSVTCHPRMGIKVDKETVVITSDGDAWFDKSLHGLTRALIANMMLGVSQGFEKKLEIIGVGYGAKVTGQKLELTVGFSKPVTLMIPAGIKIVLADTTHISVQGPDKQKVGQFAAEIRSVRKPEPYKGTGIKYDGEVIRRKAGKAFGAGGK